MADEERRVRVFFNRNGRERMRCRAQSDGCNRTFPSRDVKGMIKHMAHSHADIWFKKKRKPEPVVREPDPEIEIEIEPEEDATMTDGEIVCQGPGCPDNGRIKAGNLVTFVWQDNGRKTTTVCFKCLRNDVDHFPSCSSCHLPVFHASLRLFRDRATKKNPQWWCQICAEPPSEVWEPAAHQPFPTIRHCKTCDIIPADQDDAKMLKNLSGTETALFCAGCQANIWMVAQ
jgi:hypothetical protein